MKSASLNSSIQSRASRRGSTLLIVLSLLGLLAFTGMVFYTFAAQERSAADYFSEAAKEQVDEPDDPFPFALRQVLVGPRTSEKNSILSDSRQRHSLLGNAVGDDAVIRSGEGINFVLDGNIPQADLDYDGAGDGYGLLAPDNPLNLVGSLVAWAGAPTSVVEGDLVNARAQLPAPDVDYTYPDINNAFLAFRGWGIRDNGAGVPAEDRYERIPVFIPSFLRPSLLKTGLNNGNNGNTTPTDLNWYDHTTHPENSLRSFRPSEHHIAGFDSSGTPVRRYIDAANPADAALAGTYGVFPLRPGEDQNTAEFGRMGVYTGHSPGTVAAPDPDNFRLDQDNDGDGIFEGIWLDLGYPIREKADGTLYGTVFSFTIYDLASLIDLNTHGNISALVRTEGILDQVGSGTGSTNLASTFLSASNQGVGPHEVNPLWALAPLSDTATTDTTQQGQFASWFGAAPTNRLEEANMQLIWLLTGRIDSTDQVLDGRWGDANALWYHFHGDDGSGGTAGNMAVSSLPRPGRSGDLVTASSNDITFGGFQGFDDNANALDGVASTFTGVGRGYVHPLDLAGTGRSTFFGNPLLPNLFRDNGSSAEQWIQYDGYSMTGLSSNILNESLFISGRDQDLNTTADNLFTNPRYNLAFEDPSEVIVDQDQALRPDDAIYSAEDLVPAHLSALDVGSSTTTLSTRLSGLGVAAFADGSSISDRFTTISNLLRSVPFHHDLTGSRAWETSADEDGDGLFEFPPSYGVAAYGSADPFRPEIRRLLTSEANESRELISQLPISLNHILDINRRGQTPPEGTAEYSAYLRRAGMRFRNLTEHPFATETDDTGNTFAELTSIPLYTSTEGQRISRNFPPRTFAEREFWARRDRQKLARDIYVLLYTIGRTNAGDARASGIHTDEQMRRMAQFAVNVVDAMDADDVVTMFEYDKVLSDGWNLDDDPYTENPAVNNTAGSTDNGLYLLDTTERGVVFGVEAQQLSLSESLAVRMEDFSKYSNTSDDPTTAFDDLSAGSQLGDPDNERRDRYVLHLELQNNQPYPVPLSVDGVTGTTNGQHAIWQIARVDRDSPGTAPPTEPSNEEQQTTLTPVGSPSEVDGGTMSFMDGNGSIPGGSRFSVAMATASNTGAGDALRSDPLGTGNCNLFLQKPMQTDYVLISPDRDGVVAGASNAPECHLDTLAAAHTSRFIYNDANTDPGKFLEELPYAASGRAYFGNEAYGFGSAEIDDNGTENTGQGLEVVLRRRLNPNLPLLPLEENPWVEVDRIRVEFKDLFTFASNAGNLESTPRFEEIASSEREEPLDATSAIDSAHPAASSDPLVDDYRYNTIAFSDTALSGVNDATTANGGTFNLWQPHFDRAYASPVELFHVPVVGPRFVTDRLERMRYAPAHQVSASLPTAVGATPDVDGDPGLAGSAAAMFLLPDVAPANYDVDDNTWYRLFQFVEVPSRVNTMLGEYLQRLRLPGRVNLNGIRHVEVYAGLIDDSVLMNVPVLKQPGTGSTANDVENQYMPFTFSQSSAVSGNTIVDTAGGTTNTLTYRDRWFEFVAERDGMTVAYDPDNTVPNTETAFWIPGTTNAKPFRSFGHIRDGAGTAVDHSIFRELRTDTATVTQDRTWLEVGNPANFAATATTHRETQQLLSKIYNNSSTTSDVFIVYATAAYFNAYDDPSGLFRLGGRIGLDLDNNSVETDDAGWEQRAVFVFDRSELVNAFDETTGSFDWQRLIKYRADLASDSQ